MKGAAFVIGFLAGAWAATYVALKLVCNAIKNEEFDE